MNQELIEKWNSSNYQYIAKNISLNDPLDLIDSFLLTDALIQIKEIEKAKKIIKSDFLDRKEDTFATFLSIILELKIFTSLGDYETVSDLLDNVDKLQFKPEKPSEFEKFIILFISLTKAFLFYMKNEFSKAILILDTINNDSINIESDFKIFNISQYYNLRGLIEWKNSNHLEALQIITHSMTINRIFGNKIKLANDYLVISHIYIDLGEFLKSLLNLEEAKRIYSDLNEYHGIKMVYLSIAEIKYMQGKLDDALKTFQESIPQLEGNDYQISEIYLLIGKIYQKRKEYDKALLNYEKSLHLATKIQFVYYQSMILVNIIDLLVNTQQHEKIKPYKNQFDKKTDNETIKKMYLMVDALEKQSKNELKEAKKAWSFINTESNLPIHLKIYSFENTLKLCLLLWKDEKELGLLTEIEEIIDKWEKLATDNFLMSSLATINLLKAKFYLAMFQIDEAKIYLNKGLNLANKHDLEIDKQDMEKDKEKLEKIEQLQNNNLRARGTTDINFDEILDYLKNVKMSLILDKN